MLLILMKLSSDLHRHAHMCVHATIHPPIHKHAHIHTQKKQNTRISFSYIKAIKMDNTHANVHLDFQIQLHTSSS